MPPGVPPIHYCRPVSDLVVTQVEDRVALITVNDPDRRNAVTAEISAALRAAVDAAEADPGVHAVIVTGAGKAFCAGADLTALGAAAEDGLRVIYDGFLAVANCSLKIPPPALKENSSSPS